MLRFYNLFAMRRIVTIGHAPENFIVSHNKSDTVVELFDRRHSNYISTITSQPRGFSCERAQAGLKLHFMRVPSGSEMDPSRVNSVPRESDREEQREPR